MEHGILVRKVASRYQNIFLFTTAERCLPLGQPRISTVLGIEAFVDTIPSMLAFFIQD